MKQPAPWQDQLPVPTAPVQAESGGALPTVGMGVRSGGQVPQPRRDRGECPHLWAAQRSRGLWRKAQHYVPPLLTVHRWMHESACSAAGPQLLQTFLVFLLKIY